MVPIAFGCGVDMDSRCAVAMTNLSLSFTDISGAIIDTSKVH